MSLLRYTLKATAIALGLLGVACGLLWYKFGDSISPEMWRHAENVWHGYTPITGDRTPGELIRYAKRRLEGHPNLETIALPPLHWAQARVERPVPSTPLPTLGKGQQAFSLPPIQYTAAGRPIEAEMGLAAAPSGALDAQIFLVASAESLISAIQSAKAGQTILLAPGLYAINSQINTNANGTALQPITVRAAQPGQVKLEVNSQVAFRISKAYWIFENLQIKGVCKEHSDCEHAFHIFGPAQNTVIRNNLLEDFNAHIKINGYGNDWPDHGLAQFNTLTNSRRRETHYPVTTLDMVGANYWRLSDNLVTNFVKGDGNQISYGVFMKGAGTGGRIERNLIICTPQHISQTGVRVGISFGGGGTGKPYCRDRKCDNEYTAGLAANNIVAHCNDFGIDVNQSNKIIIANNTLINTAGIDTRGDAASAKIYGNLFDGKAIHRNNSEMRLEFNEQVDINHFFDDADSLNLVWRKLPEKIPSLPVAATDFCKRQRVDGTFPGATAEMNACFEAKKGKAYESNR